MKGKTISAIAPALRMKQPDGSTGICIPYGSYRFGKYRGTETTQTFDEASADALANELAAAVARDEPGIPVYQGHPDVPSLASKYPDKAAIGWVKAWQKTREGVRAVVEWLRDPGKGFGWHSPYWFGPIAPAGAGLANCHVDHIESIGLTNAPNIPEFRLANEARQEEPDKESTTMTPEQIEALRKALGLPEDATPEQIVEAARKAAADKAAAEAAKATAEADAATKVEAAQAEADAAKEEKRKSDEAFANERAARIGLTLDQALAAGNITPAMRPAWEKRLGEDFEAGRAALANERAVKTNSALSGLSPAAAATAGDPAARRAALVNERMRQTGCTRDEAWFAESDLHPELFR